MVNRLRQRLSDNTGAALVEYALIIAGVALIGAATVSVFGHKTNDMLATTAAVLPGAHAEDNAPIVSGRVVETSPNAAGFDQGNSSNGIGLDVNTLFLVTIYVEAMLGLLLLFAWVQNSGIHAVAWWGCAHLLQAGSVCLFGMYGTVSDAISIDLANALLFTAFAVTWTGARVFDGRMPQPLYIVGGAILWLLASRTPFFAESMDARVLLSSGIITAYTWATAYEFWQIGRAHV